MGAPRISIAGLMILVGVAAIDCAIVVKAGELRDRSAALAVCLLLNVLPVVTAAGLAIPLALRRPARRGDGLKIDLGHSTAGPGPGERKASGK
jgi:hypothetical protein